VVKYFVQLIFIVTLDCTLSHGLGNMVLALYMFGLDTAGLVNIAGLYFVVVRRTA